MDFIIRLELTIRKTIIFISLTTHYFPFLIIFLNFINDWNFEKNLQLMVYMADFGIYFYGSLINTKSHFNLYLFSKR